MSIGDWIFRPFRQHYIVAGVVSAMALTAAIGGLYNRYWYEVGTRATQAAVLDSWYFATETVSTVGFGTDLVFGPRSCLQAQFKPACVPCQTCDAHAQKIVASLVMLGGWITWALVLATAASAIGERLSRKSERQEDPTPTVSAIALGHGILKCKDCTHAWTASSLKGLASCPACGRITGIPNDPVVESTEPLDGAGAM